MRFADFREGPLPEAGPFAVRAEDMLAFARQWDPQWFHTQADAAKAGPFGGLIASGWHTCAIAMRLAVDAFLHDSESFASPGLEQVRWPSPVRPDDLLRLRATVLEARISRSKPHLGVLRWRWVMLNQSDREVLDLLATSLFDLRQSESLTG